MDKKEIKRNGIVIAGSLIADVYYKIETYPKEGQLANMRETEWHVGGTGNMIQDLARLDPEVPLEVSALIGNDHRGNMVMDKLSRYPNIYLNHVKRSGKTPVTFVMNALDSGERTFFFNPAACDEYSINDIDWDNLKGSIFHLEYILIMEKMDEEDAEYGTHGARILHEARKRGMQTSIDVVSRPKKQAQKIIASALRYTDYCSINEVEAEVATGIDLTSSEEALEAGAESAVRKLKEFGVAKWAVIHSPKRSYGLDCEKDQFMTVSSLELPDGFIKGNNGAGDAYCAGIIYGVQRGDTLEDAMKLATACAACSLSEEGGSGGMRCYEEVMELARKYRR